MADPTGPINPLHPQKPQAAEPAKNPSQDASSKSSGPFAQPITFLGMHFTGPEAQKLWYAIMQQINASIQHEQARMLKALKKLRKSSSGED